MKKLSEYYRNLNVFDIEVITKWRQKNTIPPYTLKDLKQRHSMSETRYIMIFLIDRI